MKLTLLEMTQDILNDMDGDNVNSISDTIESQQVAQIVKTSYLEMMAHRDWPHLRTHFVCNGRSNAIFPTTLVLPETIKELRWIKYNKRRSTDTKDKYESVDYMRPEDFQNMLAARDSSASNIYVSISAGLRLNLRNDIAPSYWTSFDDSEIIFDSYDSDVDSVVQKGKNDCWGIRNPTWSHLDASIPDLPSDAFPALLEEAKSTAFYVLKQVSNDKAEQKARRQNTWLARKAWRVNGGIQYPNYGRKVTGMSSNKQFDKDWTV